MRADASFFICGLVNNLVYVVFLSAASDIFKGLEGLVLIADIVPALFSKFMSPYVTIDYDTRFRICTGLSIAALVLNTFESLDFCLTGVVLASFSSGLGEASFLSLSSKYPKDIIGWFSGTGMAGLFGSFLYFFMTTVCRFSKITTMIVMSPSPLLLYYSYYNGLRLMPNDSVESLTSTGEIKLKIFTITDKLRVVRTAVVPFMIPLFLVYYSEYVINQGILPTIIFDVNENSFFKKPRDYYVAYQMIYQLGVFISRSSTSIYRIPHHKWLYLLSGLQFVNVWIFMAQSIHHITNIYVICLLVLYEGFLGGGTYSNAFACLLEFNPTGNYEELDESSSSSSSDSLAQAKSVKEFLMGAVSLADTFGITFAGFTSLFVGAYLCKVNGMECG